MNNGLRRAVFFDRDGVLNKATVRNGKPYPPATLDQFEIVAGAKSGLESLKKLGLLLLVVTNQPDIARGAQNVTVVDEMNAKLRRELPLDEILVCPHDDADQCNCRKPLPGLMLQAAAKYGIDLKRSFLVGDRWRDIDAGNAAGCATILIDFSYEERAPSAEPDIRVASLEAAVQAIHETIAREKQG